jgi:metal-dependent hydrolase (beta-lactamase superfamily II)
MIAMTLLSENTVREAGLLGQHGLSYWLETGTHCVLFDTGQGMVLTQNATNLGIDLGRAEAIVLSHGHYDHVSGLPQPKGQPKGQSHEKTKGSVPRTKGSVPRKGPIKYNSP